MKLLAHLLEQIKPKHEEEELEAAAAVTIDVEEDASQARALAERVYEEDVAKSVQAKMLGEEHDKPVKHPKDDWSIGFVPPGVRKTRP